MIKKLLSLIISLTVAGNLVAGTQSLDALTSVADRYEVDLQKVSDFFNQKGIDLMQTDNVDLFFVTYKWLNTRYVFGGNSKKGIDCSHYTQMLHTEALNSDLTGNSKEQYSKCTLVSKDELHEGDLVFFRINSSNITHVGLYLGNNKFTHSTCSKGVIVSDLSEDYWSRYYFKSARYTPSEVEQDLVEQQ
jgi:lipoprotein Spr